MLRFESIDHCQRFMDEKNIRQFDIKFCNLIGGWHHITLTRQSLDAKIVEKGVGFDSSSIPRLRDVRSGDMAAKPDLSACFIDPTWEELTLSAFADIVEAGSGAEAAMDPRSVLKRAVSYLRESGVADEFVCAPELEFYLFAEVEFFSDRHEGWYRLGSPGVGRPINGQNRGTQRRLRETSGYLATSPKDWWQNERAEMASQIAEAGLPVRYHHREVGPSGQQEIEFGFMPALTAADAILLGKYTIRATAKHRGIEACFIPKPIAGSPGNGLHIHFRLLKDGENLFSGDGYGGLSELGKHFAGGLLSHGRALLALTSASTNSYRRLRPGHETPTRFFYSVGNREAAVRIPKYSTGKHSRCEFRPGDATMNPYLGIAAMLMAGLDGVRNRIDPTPGNFGPFDGALPPVDPKEHPTCFLPDNLSEALDALEQDHEFLLAGGVFDKALLDNYTSYKREDEIAILAGTPHPLEYEMYWGL